MKTGSFFDSIIGGTMLDKLSESFIREKKYSQNVAANTIINYQRRYHKVYRKFLDGILPTKADLSELVIKNMAHPLVL